MRSSIIGRQVCVKCNEQRDHVRFGRRVEPSKTPDTTSIWAEFWDCDHCGNHLEKREERPWPTDRDIITKRLLKVATDYEQVKASHSRSGTCKDRSDSSYIPGISWRCCAVSRPPTRPGFYRAS